MLSRITRIPALLAWPLLGLSTLVACDGGDAVERSGLAAADPAASYALIEDPTAPIALPTLDAAGVAALASAPQSSVSPATSLWLSDRLERPSCAVASPTTTVRVTLRLDATAPMSRGTFDALAPWQTAQAAVPAVVFGVDSACVPLDLYLRRVDAWAWRWWMVVDGRHLRGGVYGLPTEISTGDLHFDVAGRLIAQEGGDIREALAGTIRPWDLRVDFSNTLLAPGPSQTERVLFDGCYEAGSEACL